MPTEIARGEFEHLEARVEVVETEVEGEKMVTRYILEQTRRNSDNLAAIKTRLERVEGKVDGLEHKVGGLERGLDGLTQEVRGLRRELPKIVGDVVREVFSERDGHS